MRNTWCPFCVKRSFMNDIMNLCYYIKGWFAKKTDGEGSNHSGKEKDNGTDSVLSSQSISSSGSEPLHSDSAETWNSPNMQQDARASKVHNSRFEAPSYQNGSGSYHNHNGLQSSVYHSSSGERVEERDCSGQQLNHNWWGVRGRGWFVS